MALRASKTKASKKTGNLPPSTEESSAHISPPQFGANLAAARGRESIQQNFRQ